MANSKRKKHFVDGSVQGTMIVRIIGHWFLYLVVTGTFVFGLEVLSSDVDEAFRNLLSRHGLTLLVVLVLTPIFTYDLCLMTHRFAGPMVRLKRAMADLADGQDVKHIKFRDGDFCQQLSEAFNRVVDRFEAERTRQADDQLACDQASDFVVCEASHHT